MEKKLKSYTSMGQLLDKNSGNINYIFLGVGLTLFVTNISSLISFVKGNYTYSLFDISVFGAILIIIISVYNIFNSK